MVDNDEHQFDGSLGTAVDRVMAAEVDPVPAQSVPASGGLILSPAWLKRVEQAARDRGDRGENIRVVPLSPRHFSEQTTRVLDAAGARQLVDLAWQRPIARVGLDCEFTYSRPPVSLKRDQCWQDPRSIVPLLLGVVLVEIDEGGIERRYRISIDCRRPEVVAALADLFRLSAVFVGHFLKAELFCLWVLGLAAPDAVWDTWAAERALLLGRHHRKNKDDRTAGEAEEAAAQEDAEAARENACTLVASCQRRGVPYAYIATKERLRKSFLEHPAGQPFSDEQIEYNLADAEAAAALYPAQVHATNDQGCLRHLVEVEMPWTVTNARIEWDGVRVDRQKCEALLAACRKHYEPLAAKLAATHGIANANSPVQLRGFFERVGLLDAFRTSKGFSFENDRLEIVEDRHPAVPMIRMVRKIGRLLSDRGLLGDLTGADGRLHPEHRQLGADSGRNTMRAPNIGGIGKVLRPVVVPEAGYGLGEVDLSQIEVGIAAAIYDDLALIDMFNKGDVYSQMAKAYYAAELPADALALPDKAFKKAFVEYRKRMKIYTLAIIYGITPFGLALHLNTTQHKAAEERERFLTLFPALAAAQRREAAYGAIRGYAPVCSGLRRHRGRSGAPTAWESNWLLNVPVQGSACVVFKIAGNRLYRRYQYYGARIVLPLHDAYIFEAPLDRLAEVAQITAEVLKSSVQEAFPRLEPDVEVNIDHPECWNKDGRADSLGRWIENPLFTP